MIYSTLSFLKCPKKKCASSLQVLGTQKYQPNDEIEWGELQCLGCKKIYPIIAGVLILIPETEAYIEGHAKGIHNALGTQATKLLLPFNKSIRQAYAEGLEQLDQLLEDTDSESLPVIELYQKNHFLSSSEIPLRFAKSTLREEYLKAWDHGPIQLAKTKILEFIKSHSTQSLSKTPTVFELGCSVGGLGLKVLKELSSSPSFYPLSYFGMDLSFLSVYQARKNLKKLRTSTSSTSIHSCVDYWVADLEFISATNSVDLLVSLNVVDMFDDPFKFLKFHAELCQPNSQMLVCTPYSWSKVAQNRIQNISNEEWLRKSLKQLNFLILEEHEHLPWAFLKDPRHVELYSVHFVHTKLGTK